MDRKKKERRPFEPAEKSNRPPLSPAQEEWAERVKERNDWLQRGMTGEIPKGIYGERPDERESK